MAFDYLNWQRWSAGFDLNNNAQWNYTTDTENMAAISASGYFNAVNTNPSSPELNVNDSLYLVASDAVNFAIVTAISPDVTVELLDPALGVGNVMTANIADLAVTTAKIADGAVTTDKLDDAAVTSAKLEDLLVHHARVTMTAVQWDAMYVSPFELVPAPGASEKLIPMRVVVNIDYGGTVFADGGVIFIQYDDTTLGAGPQATGTLAAATFIGYTADTTFAFTPVDTTLVDSTTLGTSLCISNATGAFTGGTSSAFIVDVWYAIADYA